VASGMPAITNLLNDCGKMMLESFSETHSYTASSKLAVQKLESKESEREGGAGSKSATTFSVS